MKLSNLILKFRTCLKMNFLISDAINIDIPRNLNMKDDN